MKKYVLMLSILFSSISIFAQGIQFEHGTWSEVLAKAKKENKLVFVDIYTTWCGPCKMMSNEIFPLENVGTFFNSNFINYKIDAEKGEGITVADKYSVQAYPTYLYVDGNGDLAYRSLGSMPADKFIAEGNKALEAKNLKGVDYYQSNYEASKNDTAFLTAYINRLKSLKLNSADVVNQYISLLPADQKVSDATFKMIESGSSSADLNQNLVKFYLENKDQFEAISPILKGQGRNMLRTVAYNTLRNAAKAKDENQLNTLIAFDQKYFNGASANNYYENYYKMTKNPSKYFEYVQKRLDKVVANGKAPIAAQSKQFLDQNILQINSKFKGDEAKTKVEEFKSNYGDYIEAMTASDMNTAAWNVVLAYANGKDKDKSKLEKAATWIKFATELNPTSSGSLDTYACIQYYLGKKSEAIKLEENALALATKDNDKQLTADFKSKIATMKANKELKLDE